MIGQDSTKPTLFGSIDVDFSIRIYLRIIASNKGEVVQDVAFSSLLNVDLLSLIQLEAMTTNEWYSKYVYPNIYQNYPYSGNLTIDEWKPASRKEGIPPLLAMNLYQTNEPLVLGSNDVVA